MSKNIPRQQHYVPRMLLKHFVKDDGHLWYIDRKWHKPEAQRRTPKTIFFEFDIYNQPLEGGGIDGGLEEMYQREESQVDIILQKIVSSVRQGRLPHLTKDEKQAFNSFQYNLQRRAPEFHKDYLHGSKYDETKLEVAEFLRQRDGELPPNFDEVWEMQQFKQEIKIGALKARSERALPYLNSLGIGFLRPENPRDSFVIGANPVATVPMKRKNTPSLLIYPLAYDLAAAPLNPALGQEMILAPLSRADMRKVNEKIASQGRTVGGRSRRTVEGLFTALKASE